MADGDKQGATEGLDKDYPPEEQAAWDEQSEHARVADVTGVGPYDTDRSEDAEE